MIYDNVLECMGQTPIIRLNRMVEEDRAGGSTLEYYDIIIQEHRAE